MILHRYRVRYWTSVDWCWISETLIAQSESQVIEYVDKQVKPEHRMKRNDRNEVYQTLEIEDEGEITLPYPID